MVTFNQFFALQEIGFSGWYIAKNQVEPIVRGNWNYMNAKIIVDLYVNYIVN